MQLNLVTPWQLALVLYLLIMLLLLLLLLVLSPSIRKRQEEKQEQATKPNVTPIAALNAPNFAVVDTDFLDCPICYQPLCSPVYQCQNCHLVCESCCKKILNKCPSCSLPIGSNRCRQLRGLLNRLLLHVCTQYTGALRN